MLIVSTFIAFDGSVLITFVGADKVKQTMPKKYFDKKYKQFKNTTK